MPKLIGIIGSIYVFINLLYFLNLIPPVPLALDEGIVAHDISIENYKYVVSYEKEENTIFWRDHKLKFSYTPGEKVYVFSSIFAPTDFKKSIFHSWKWYNAVAKEWEVVEDIGFNITGGRNGGFRGYTYKSNVKSGQWEVDVITEEGLVLGVIDFEIVTRISSDSLKVAQRKF